MDQGVVIEPGASGGGDDDDDREDGRVGLVVRHFDVIIACLLGLAAVVAAFAAYQAALKDGDTLAAFQEGNRIADTANQRFSQAAANRNEDQIVTTFIIKETLDRPNADTNELGNLLVEEIGSEPLKRANAECDANDCNMSPIDSPYYRLPAQAEGERLTAKADKLFASAHADDKTGDRYELVTVIVALSLFLYGVAAVARARGLKLGMAGIGLVIFLVSLGLLVTV
jgi:hypothetical protein